MPQFSYRAVGRDGKSTEGTIEALAPEMATRELRSQGLTLLALEEGLSAASGNRKPGGKALGRKQILSFTSELAVLLRAGLPLDRGLKVLIDMASEPGVSSLLNELLQAVKGGQSFSQALQPHEALFGTFYLSMVKSGEASGQLSMVLDRLVEHLENARANRESVVSALIYPAILLFVATLSIVVMLGFVVPQFEALFEDMGEGLPALTRVVISGGDFIQAWWWLMAILVGGLVFYVRSWAATEAGRKSLDQWLLDLPLAGGIIFQFEVSKFSRTVGTLLGNGVSLLKAISIAIETVGNRVIAESLEVLPPAVKSGKRMSVALEESGMFTPMVIQMVRVGEESGSLGEMMLELARVFDHQVQSGTKRGITLLEPVLILGMGFIIALIIVAILAGVMSVNDLAG
jgi:general secretion pathway protein F